MLMTWISEVEQNADYLNQQSWNNLQTACNRLSLLMKGLRGRVDLASTAKLLWHRLRSLKYAFVACISEPFRKSSGKTDVIWTKRSTICAVLRWRLKSRTFKITEFLPLSLWTLYLCSIPCSLTSREPREGTGSHGKWLGLNTASCYVKPFRQEVRTDGQTLVTRLCLYWSRYITLPQISGKLGALQICNVTGCNELHLPSDIR
jgi:hypothetical protein